MGYDYEPVEDKPTRFLVRDDDSNSVAWVYVEADAREIVAALNLIERLTRAFPGLADGETDVNGGDLVDLINQSLRFAADGRYHEPEDLPHE